MKAVIPENHNLKLDKPANWDEATLGPCHELHVRASQETGIVTLTSAWKPTAEELRMLNAGGVIEVELCTGGQPPMRVYVAGSKPNDEERPTVVINEHAHGDDHHDRV